jgi:hypothetical protein
MQVSPNTNLTPVPSLAGRASDPSRRADLLYQTVTVAAILLVLASLWAF